MDFDCLDCVVGAAWAVAAASPEKRGEDDLVSSDERDKNRSHSNLSSAITSAVRLPLSAALPTSTHETSSGSSGATRRNPSRRMRFARFRSTASWKLFFETTTPAWRPAPGSCKIHAETRCPRSEHPRSKTRLYFAPGSRADILLRPLVTPVSGACAPGDGD